MPLSRPVHLLFAFALLLSGCNERNEGALDVVWIGSEEDLLADGLRLSAGAQHLRAATESGLVALDIRGEAMPALAERWIITEDGLSFIFRLREERWADGSEMTSESVRRALRRTIRALDGTSLGLDLAPIDEIRAMTGRVIEIRLTSPVPDLLILLAQPELALRSSDGGSGLMTLVREEGRDGLLLRFKPPAQRGLPDTEGWQDEVREIALSASNATDALARFDDGVAAVVLGGRIDQLPLVETGPLSRGTVRIDAVIGLFGLRVQRADGLLGDQAVREAIAMAIDRNALMAPYNLDGWVPTTRLVAPGLPGDPGLISERWPETPLEDLRVTAAGRIANWLSAHQNDGPQVAQVSLALDDTPGLNILFRNLSGQFAAIGIQLVRAKDARRADLVLVDSVARYPDARWFLNQFHCSLDLGLCDEDADYLLELAQEAQDPAEQTTFLAEAEAELTLANVYIPIGAPLRWSLVRSNVDGFAANQFGFHPLPQMAQIPK